jgi:WD40 repeat protein
LATFDNHRTNAIITLVEWAANHTLTNLSVPSVRHGDAAVVDFSPDGSRLAIGEDYGRIRILNWRMGTMVAMTNLTQTGEGVTALAFSPSSELLATGFGNGRIRLWDASSGESRGQWTNPAGTIRALAFTPDGQRLASAGSDRTVRIWSFVDQFELRCWRGHESEGMALAFLPDGKTLASGCRESTVCFWDPTVSSRPPTHTSLVISMGLDSPSHLDARNYAPGELSPGVVRRLGFTFTPDGRSFITTDPDGSLGLWDTRSVQRTESLPALGSNNWGVALSPDGHWLAVGSASGRVNLWDWRERRRVASFEAPFEWLGHLRFSRNGRFLWAMVMFNDWTTRCRIWRTEDWQEVPLAGVQVAGLWCADFSPDDRLLAAGYATGAVKLWDFPSGRHETTFTNQAASVCAVLFSPDGRMLTSTSLDGTTRLRDLFAHREVATLRGHVGAVGGAALSSDGRRLATGGSDARDAVRLWDLATHRELLSLQGEGELLFAPVAFSPDGSTLMAASFAGIAHLWRAPSWVEIEAAEKGHVAP